MKFIVPLIVLALGFGLYFYTKPKHAVPDPVATESSQEDLAKVQNAEEEEGEVGEDTTEIAAPQAGSTIQNPKAQEQAKPAEWQNNKKLSDREKASIEGYMNVFSLYSGQYQKQPDALLKQLAEIGLKPQAKTDKNPYTGGMLTIRTQNALAGTRYFHAQFQKDENNDVFLQHMSVEFRKSPETFDSVVKMVKKQFPNAKQKKSRNKQFAEFSSEDGYNIWVKILAKEDLENDPDNAYAPEDVGTVRFAVEQELH